VTRPRSARPGYSDTLTRIERLREGGGDWPDWRKTVIDSLEELAELGEDVKGLERTVQVDHGRRLERLERETARRLATDQLARRIAHLEDAEKHRGALGHRALHWIVQTTTALALLIIGVLVHKCTGVG
jgi:hypothetical protein